LGVTETIFCLAISFAGAEGNRIDFGGFGNDILKGDCLMVLSLFFTMTVTRLLMEQVIML
jgi:hypothetical protein